LVVYVCFDRYYRDVFAQIKLQGLQECEVGLWVPECSTRHVWYGEAAGRHDDYQRPGGLVQLFRHDAAYLMHLVAGKADEGELRVLVVGRTPLVAGRHVTTCPAYW